MEITSSVDMTMTLKVCTACTPCYYLCLKVVFVWVSELKSVPDFVIILDFFLVYIAFKHFEHITRVNATFTWLIIICEYPWQQNFVFLVFVTEYHSVKVKTLIKLPFTKPKLNFMSNDYASPSL